MIRYRPRSPYRSRRFFDPFERAIPRTSSRQAQKLLAKIRDAVRTGENASLLILELIRRFTHDPLFFGKSRPVLDEELEQAVMLGVDALYPDEVDTLHVSFMEVPKHKLTHGILLAESILGLVLFFEEMGQGLLVLSTDGLDSEMSICRLTRIELPPLPVERPN